MYIYIEREMWYEKNEQCLHLLDICARFFRRSSVNCKIMQIKPSYHKSDNKNENKHLTNKYRGGYAAQRTAQRSANKQIFKNEWELRFSVILAPFACGEAQVHIDTVIGAWLGTENLKT